jgi:hypothetical protein
MFKKPYQLPDNPPLPTKAPLERGFLFKYGYEKARTLERCRECTRRRVERLDAYDSGAGSSLLNRQIQVPFPDVGDALLPTGGLWVVINALLFQ